MRLVIFTEPQQGATHDDLLRVAKAAEDGGYDGFFRSDHYLKMGDVSGLPGPTDAWITLAALAVQTSRIRLGTLVSSATFRLPGPLAIAVAQVDAMSGGRVEFGLGGGWFEAEHRAYGIPFPTIGERFDRLEEQLEIITGLWETPAGATYDFDGKHYQISGSPALPKPVQSPRVPVIVGGHGKKRTPYLAARYATEFNVPFSKISDIPAQYSRVRAAAEALGRTEPLTYSAAAVLCVGRDDAEIRRRAAAIGRDVEEMRENGGIVGTPAEAVETIGRYAEAGASRLFLQVLDLSDLDHIDLVASEVAARL
ncbi:F420-dependent oxidoreductase-like protein [Actinoplanes campanulatus]|uniref:F420-dependent oxidoreductase-like protein n=1 Tax=Actinoplanes campanulatus TaxID=113559 RepID=A0A7W5FCA6_9ACTN|nr:LLM class F420-dependent oxidoreductase [Actinoplanes campanulatus]MBB3093025.1 F420-dependent oxidoreductase-like protein [Actinoplanes campanulatus]GGN00670.1 LLM class F420-dependent oxidoreductase [Actinoplanes campanulatus]GID33878.1 LLM class F420-dependent oxidoreductase [Actinoplanes campanulatus]